MVLAPTVFTSQVCPVLADGHMDVIPATAIRPHHIRKNRADIVPFRTTSRITSGKLPETIETTHTLLHASTSLLILPNK